MKKLIYRIEDKYGNGFYNGRGDYDNFDHEDRVKLHLFKYRHMTPYVDKGIRRNSEKGEKCGFLNEKQLYDWLDISKIRRLEKLGFKLVRLYREVVAIGEYQVLFLSIDLDK